MTLTDLKRPWLSTADLLSTPKPIANPFPIFDPPVAQKDPYNPEYPPIQKIVYYLHNSTYRATLTNTSAPGFPALEEWGGYNTGGQSGVGFSMTGWGVTPLALGAGAPRTKEAAWEWTNVASLDGVRWRWDGFWPRGQKAPRMPGQGGDYGGLCLPPRVATRRKGKKEVGVEVVQVVGGGCGVVRVCGARRGEKEKEKGGRGQERGRKGDEAWRSGGWKREVEDRWAVVVGLVAWEVERWGGCCVSGG